MIIMYVSRLVIEDYLLLPVMDNNKGVYQIVLHLQQGAQCSNYSFVVLSKAIFFVACVGILLPISIAILR